MNCPYRGIDDDDCMDDDDGMDMVRHDNECIQLDRGEPVRQSPPLRFYNSSGIAHRHFPVDNLSKQAFPAERTDADEIRTGGGIVEIAQTYRTAVMNFGVIGHGSLRWRLIPFSRGNS